jgi:hypothetical protein
LGASLRRPNKAIHSDFSPYSKSEAAVGKVLLSIEFCSASSLSLHALANLVGSESFSFPARYGLISDWLRKFLQLWRNYYETDHITVSSPKTHHLRNLVLLPV